uniref:Uncharacterized protein n=1 Tax=Leersia perrieri TaxID=77586 RepID=A0A0D9XZQ9_9ORYZ
MVSDADRVLCVRVSNLLYPVTKDLPHREDRRAPNVTIVEASIQFQSRAVHEQLSMAIYDGR